MSIQVELEGKPVFLLQSVEEQQRLLTREEGMRIQFVPPLVADLHCFGRLRLVLSRMALVVGMLKQH